MRKNRMEAFSDGMIAIFITIMVLNLAVPSRSDLHGLDSDVPVFLSYMLSFLNLGIYWTNHHHLLQATERVSGAVLWANLHLLFWLSLFPFFTAWMGKTGFKTIPVLAYGVVSLLAAIAYYLLQSALVAAQGPESTLAVALGRDIKGKISPVILIAALPLVFVSRWISIALYIVIVLIWLVPDPRLESRLNRAEDA